MKNIFDLTGQIAFVTGASSGLGVQFAKTLADAGAKVIVAARRMPMLEDTVSKIRKEGGEASPVYLDVCNKESIREAFDKAADIYGVPDILVNNSGVAGGRFAVDTDEEEWDAIVDTNLKGVWLVSKEGAIRMIAAKKPTGSIINLSSIMSIRTHKAATAYAASKGGVQQLTRTMALELSRNNIRVNALAPGYFWSDMTDDTLKGPFGEKMLKNVPMGRFGSAEDLAGALLLLASPIAGAYITASTLFVDGGHSQSSL